MPTMTADQITDYAASLFRALGLPDDESALVARSLADSNLAGHDSHGIIRVPQYAKALADGILRGGVSLKIRQETPAVAVCDGQWGLGQVQAHRLLDLIIPKARTLGIAAGTLYQCGHIGRLGEYGERAGREGLSLVATVNNHGFGRAVAPPGGKVGRIATNPLCIGIPMHEGPVVLDIGTSAVAEGKVRVCFNKGVPAPEGWLLDAEGEPTNDPGVLYSDPRGTIRPLGGSQAYKGFGLGLMLDMLAGGLTGSACSRPEIGSRSANAVVFVLLDPARFFGAEHFERETSDLAANVRATPVKAGQKVTLPGDPEKAARATREKEGIFLDAGTWSQLAALAEKLGVKVPAVA